MNATMKVKKAMASTARAKGRERSNVRRFSHNGLKRFVGKGRVGLAAGIFWISRLAAAPIIASTTSRRPMTYSWFWNQYESMPPQTGMFLFGRRIVVVAGRMDAMLAAAEPALITMDTKACDRERNTA